ncbi:MAG: universal stress protein, partial [Piscinibacter sp.]|nr:universal stress protein [Piscinibacter sp.]
MFKRILVPSDGSDITSKAVDTAIALAKSVGAQLYTI